VCTCLMSNTLLVGKIFLSVFYSQFPFCLQMTLSARRPLIHLVTLTVYKDINNMSHWSCNTNLLFNEAKFIIILWASLLYFQDRYHLSKKATMHISCQILDALLFPALDTSSNQLWNASNEGLQNTY